MKVVFNPIDNILPINLTIGKIYEVVSLDNKVDNEKSPTKDYYLIKNDEGHHYSYWRGNFTELSIYRKNQIDEIISDNLS
jgi:hypothetical protein